MPDEVPIEPNPDGSMPDPTVNPDGSKVVEKVDGRKSKKTARKKKDGRAGSENGGKFVKGYDPRRVDRIGGSVAIPKVTVVGEGLIRDMKHVVNNRAIHDRTVGERTARAAMNKNPMSFRMKLHELEREEKEIEHRRQVELVRAGARDETLVDGEDKGHDAAMKILDRLLSVAEESSRVEAVTG